VRLDGSATGAEVIESLCAVRGIGPWTANYIAMRALGDPDVFPASDLGLLKAAGVSSPRRLEMMAEAWRPWRSYAALYLWESLREKG
jgi:3-methyladenine DNA glycosylase/8-oxoguanine DNA glycosylase